MSRFHPLRVAEVIKETPDCVSIAFELDESQKEDFTFVHGQYITIKAHLDNQEVRRSYSICTSPLEHQLKVAVKRVPDGIFSTYANTDLKAGDILEVMPPMGNFTIGLDAKQTHHYAAIAAGSGITPVLSIMKSVLMTEPDSSFTLFYGNRNTENIIFHEEIEALKNTYLGRLRIYYVLSRENTGSDLFYGRIDAEKCDRFAKYLIDVSKTKAVFVCGPYDMIMSAKESLMEAGMAEDKIHYELFYTPQKGDKQAESVPAEKGTESNLTITLDDNTFSFHMESSDQMILDAALKAGADLPYACKGGVCCTCKAKVLSGEVKMLVNYALEPEEVDAGYVLTCQCIPMTDSVEISFDE